jgi:hypothetical protein
VSRDVNVPQVDLTNKTLCKLVELVREEVRRRHGSELTFEQQNVAAAEVAREMLWLHEDQNLQGLVTSAAEIEVKDKRYRRLEQPSGAQYQGCWGAHDVEEPLYRLLGVHNGPTIKPIELRAGIVENMTPDLAHIVGALTADGNSREVWRTMRTVGLVPPSRSFLEKRAGEVAAELASSVEKLEAAVRAVESLPEEIASVSCGMDRMAVRMSEPHSDPDNAPQPMRRESYERTPPPRKEHNHRMAWVASVTGYDRLGTPLVTRRYAAEADADPTAIARRASADVAHLVGSRSDVPVHCIQDAARELRILPETLRTILPANTNLRELVDFEHLLGYLDDVVEASEPTGDPHNMKAWYRHELLRDDDAIDRIWRNLRRKAKTLPRSAAAERKAVAAALSYIRTRRNKMRYASLYAANLAIGSGATEGTCGLMQMRVKRRGQSWEVPGLRGILTLRSLVLSDRWSHVWNVYAATHRAEVRCAA